MVHFAGRKAVGESVEFPMRYYTHNVVGAVNLIEAMRKHGVKNVRSGFDRWQRTSCREQCLCLKSLGRCN